MKTVPSRADGIVRIAISIALLALAAMLHPTPARAESPDAQPLHSAIAYAQPVLCAERHMLAFLVQTENFDGAYEAHAAIAQIIQREADSQQLTVCALARFGTFVTPYQFAIARPNSWQARQWNDIQWWSDAIAGDVLAGNLKDYTRGARHFDGRDCGVVLWRSGPVSFCA